MGASPSQVREDLSLFVGFVGSFVLRTVTAPAERWLRKSCGVCICGRGPHSGAVLATERGLTWREVQTRLDATGSNAQLMALAALRLLGWHLLQPVSFALIFFSWSDKINGLQIGLGAAVLTRELLYLLCALVATATRPAFLMVDPLATWFSGAQTEVIMYTLMPEKFLGWYLAGTDETRKRRFNSYCTAIILFDVCGLLALYFSFSGKSPLPAPLIACYLVSAVSFFTLPCLAVLVLLAEMTGLLPNGGVRGTAGAPLDVPLEPDSSPG